MVALPVNCNRCGAKVDAVPGARHATCARCHAPLVVLRTPTSAFTDVEARQKELDRIDREWEAEKEQLHTSTTYNGRRHTWVQLHRIQRRAALVGGVVLLAVLTLLIWKGTPDDGGDLVRSMVLGCPCSWVLVYMLVDGGVTRRYWPAEAAYRELRAAAERNRRRAPADVPRARELLPVRGGRDAGPTWHVRGHCRTAGGRPRAKSVSTDIAAASRTRPDRPGVGGGEGAKHSTGVGAGAAGLGKMINRPPGCGHLLAAYSRSFMVADGRAGIVPVLVLAVPPALFLPSLEAAVQGGGRLPGAAGRRRSGGPSPAGVSRQGRRVGVVGSATQAAGPNQIACCQGDSCGQLGSKAFGS